MGQGAQLHRFCLVSFWLLGKLLSLGDGSIRKKRELNRGINQDGEEESQKGEGGKEEGLSEEERYIIQEWLRHQTSDTLSRYPTRQPSSNCGPWFGGAGKFVS